MDNNRAKKDNVFFSRNFRLVFFGALVSELGALLYSFAVSFYILEISDNNAFLQGLYLAFCGVAMLIATPVGGVLGDRVSKAKIMYVCDYLKGGGILLATVLMLLFKSPGAHIVILFVLGIVGNVVSGIFSPAAGALFPHIVEADKLQQANAYFTMKSSMISILGIILAGILYAALPIHTLFFIVGAAFVASGVSEMLIRYDHLASDEPLTLKLAVRDMAEGISYLKTKRAILALLGSLLFINFFFSPIWGNFLPFFIKTDLASSPSYLGDKLLKPELWSSVISVCYGISALIGAAVLSGRPQKDRCGAALSVRLCIMAGFMILLTFFYWMFVDRGVSLNAFLMALSLIALLIGFLLSFINIPVSTVMMRVVDKDKLSKVNSILSVGSQGMVPLSSVLAGIILQQLGSTALLAFSSIGFAVTAVLLLFNRHIKEL